MIKQETLSNNSESKEMYIKPVCDVYETELEGCILSASGNDTSVGDTEVNSFLPGREYESSVF